MTRTLSLLAVLALLSAPAFAAEPEAPKPDKAQSRTGLSSDLRPEDTDEPQTNPVSAVEPAAGADAEEAQNKSDTTRELQQKIKLPRKH